jgi:hypothetical protein
MDAKAKADRFLDVFRGECLHRRQELDYPQMMSYYGVLKDLDPFVIERAIVRLRKTSQFFPSSAEWFRVATAMALDMSEDADEAVPKGEYFCVRCGDSGFRAVNGDGPVGWRTFCECRKTNPVLAKKRNTMNRLRADGLG